MIPAGAIVAARHGPWRRLLLAVPLALFASFAAKAEPIRVEARPFDLLPGEESPRIGQLRYIAGFSLSSPHPRFGGLSGLAIDASTNRLIAVSDRGHWFTATLELATDGRLTGLQDTALVPILSSASKTAVRGHWIDAEAVTREPNGGLVVSFEHCHRLWRFGPAADATTAPPQPLPPPDELAMAPPNGGIEALVALPSGELLAITEELQDAAGNLVGWLGRPGLWQPIRYRPTGDFRPTDLALLPSGDVLALERRFSILGGVAARVQRLAAADIRPGALLSGEEIARFERPLALDNFEGLAVVADGRGKLWLYIVSDDNFSPLQQTLLLQFRLLD